MRLLNPGAFVWLFVAVMAAFIAITICQPTGSINAHHPSLQRANKDQGMTQQRNGTKSEEQDKVRQRNGTKSQEQGKVRQKNGTKSEKQDKVRQNNDTKSEEKSKVHQKNETKSEEQGKVRQKNGTKNQEQSQTHQRTGAKMPCRDLNKNCKSWAAAGECATNPAWMDVYCSNACGICEERELQEMWKLMDELQAIQTKTLKEMQHMMATINDVKSNNEVTRQALNEVKETVVRLLRQVAIMTRPPPQQCEESWSQYQSSCYKVYKTAVTHDQAKVSCMAHNAYLASIGSEEENFFLAGLIEYNTYIGCSDENHEGVFTWQDGSPFIYSKWAANEPNNLGGSENYGSMFPNSYWNDVSNGYKYHYICEKPRWV